MKKNPLPKEWESKLFAVRMPVSFCERKDAENNLFQVFSSQKAACKELAPDCEESERKHIQFIPIKDFFKDLTEADKNSAYAESINDWICFVFINSEKQSLPFTGVRFAKSLTQTTWQHSLSCLQDDWNDSDDCLCPIESWFGLNLKDAELLTY